MRDCVPGQIVELHARMDRAIKGFPYAKAAVEFAAYDLAGSDQANPLGQILSLAMMLRESFAMFEASALIEAAVKQVLGAGWRTHDMAEPGCRIAGTREMGQLVAHAVEQSAKGNPAGLS